MKSSFNDELIELLGVEFIHYDSTIKNTLTVLYRYTKYNEIPVKSALITPEIYFLENVKLIDPKKTNYWDEKLEAFVEKNESGISQKVESGGYLLNLKYAGNGLFFIEVFPKIL